MSSPRKRSLLQKARSRRSPHEEEIRQAYRLTFPSRVFDREPGSQIDRQQLFDATATESALNLVNSIMSHLVPQNSKWAGIEPRDGTTEAAMSPEELDLIKQVNDDLFAHFQESNFYVAAPESMLDCIVSGTGCMSISEDETGTITYISHPTDTLYFLEDHYQRPDAVFLEHKLSARQLVQRYGDRVPSEIREAVDRGENSDFRIVESSIPNPQTQLHDYEVWIDGDHSDQPLRKQELEVPRFVVFRWSKTLGEVWGESPTRHALPHIEVANKIQELQLAHGEYAAYGLWQVGDETYNAKNLRNKMTPGTVIPSEEEIRPIHFPGNLAISQAELENHRAVIRRMLLDFQLPPPERGNTYMTATEVDVRREEFFRHIGQPARRLEKEFLEPIIRATIMVMMRQQKIPVIMNASELFRVNVNSAAKRVMKQVELQNDLQAYIQMINAFGEEGYQIASRLIRMDEFAEKLLRDGGIDPGLLRSPRERARIQEQQQQQQAQQMMMMMQQQQHKQK